MGYKFEKYSIGGSSGDYVLELTGMKGTLTDEQYNALVANAPNVVALHSDTLLYLPLFQSVGGVFIFAAFNLSGGGINLCEGGAITCIVTPEKTYEITLNTYFLPTQTYVDEAVAGAGSLPPIALRLSSSVEEVKTALNEYLETGRPIVYDDETGDKEWWAMVSYITEPLTMHFIDVDGKQLFTRYWEDGKTQYFKIAKEENDTTAGLNIVSASSTVAEFENAIIEWQTKKKDIAFSFNEPVDGNNNYTFCVFVGFEQTNQIAYFLNPSKKQLVVVTLGESATIEYVDMRGSAPNLLHAGSTVEEFVAAMTAWQESGTDCGFVDGTEVCKFVAFNTNGIGYFFKGSTKQIIVVTLGAGVSIKYVDLGGNASLPPTILDASSDINAWVDALEAWMANGADCVFIDADNEICRFVSVSEPSARFFKGSTNQLVVATLGESVSIQYVNIGGGGGSANPIVWNVPFQLFGADQQTGTATLISGNLDSATADDMKNSTVLLAGEIPIPCIGGYPGGAMTYRGAVTLTGSIYVDVVIYTGNNSFTLTIDHVASKTQLVPRFVVRNNWSRWNTVIDEENGTVKFSRLDGSVTGSAIKHTHVVVGTQFFPFSTEAQPFYGYSTIITNLANSDTGDLSVVLNGTDAQAVIEYVESGRIATGYFAV